MTGQAESWDSGNHPTPFELSHAFTKINDFVYYCQLHGAANGDGTASGMQGIVHVQPAIPEPAIGFLGAAGVAALGLIRLRPRKRG